MALLEQLREKHPRFFYRGYSVILEEEVVRFIFNFEIEPTISFSPEVVVMSPGQKRVSPLNRKVLDNLAFHLGLMEIPSYWKATCSPEIVIQAPLDDYQICWWKDLVLKGLGEFFYKNNIDFTVSDFVNFKIKTNTLPRLRRYEGPLNSNNLLVSIGGGKDSIVTSEVLKRTKKRITCWCLNPTPAALETIRISRSKDPIIVKRIIDKRLLKLNKKGYLNGHTPFSAYLAFLGVTCAVLFDYKSVVVSNERSANEGNVSFKGREINHQYSKSFDFEKKFREYAKKYLAKEVNYFSFLRPIYELQIAKIFSRFPQYFSIFRSCNKGHSTNSWCQKCPKCLFVFATLYPFIDDRLLATIFSENLFEKEEFTETAFRLLGLKGSKPFECVGAKEENQATFFLCLKKAKQKGKPLPSVLRSLEKRIFSQNQNLDKQANSLLFSWNKEHALPKDLEALLRREMRL